MYGSRYVALLQELTRAFIVNESEPVAGALKAASSVPKTVSTISQARLKNLKNLLAYYACEHGSTLLSSPLLPIPSMA